MRETGIVKEVKNDIAEVRISRRAECAKCGLCGMKEDAAHVDIYATNEKQAKVGDIVTVEVEEKTKTLAIFLTFVMPIILVGVGILLGYVLSSEIWMVAFSVILVAAWYMGLALIDKKLANKSGFCSVIVGIEEKENGDNLH